MNPRKPYLSIIKHYENCLYKYGDSHLGVDWPKLKDVDKRYHVMLDVIKEPRSQKVTLLDFGCGVSHLFEYIQKHNIKNIKYSGLDISKKMINLCKIKFPQNRYYCIDILENHASVPKFDYIVMNGVFTEKRELSFDEMFNYFKKVLLIIFRKSKKGLAFNVMSKAVDWEREDLFHLSTDLLIAFMSKNLSRNFIMRNDYGLYEYTVYIYKTVKLI